MTTLLDFNNNKIKITKTMIKKYYYKDLYLISYMLLHGNINIVKKILKLDKNNYKKISLSVLLTLVASYQFKILLDLLSILPNDALKYLLKPSDMKNYVFHFFSNAPVKTIIKFMKWKNIIPFNTIIDNWYILRVYLSENYEKRTIDIKLLKELLILSKKVIHTTKYKSSIIIMTCIAGYDKKVLDTIYDIYPDTIGNYDSNLNTPLISAFKIKNKKLIYYILDKMDKHIYEIDYNYFGITCVLLLAIEYANNSIMEKLLSFKNLNFNVHDKYKMTPGHLIFWKNNLLSMKNKEEILNRTENFNLRNLDGNTILHFICFTNQLEDFKHICKNVKLDLFIRNTLNMTPIHYCTNLPLLSEISKVSLKEIHSVLDNTFKYEICNEINFINTTNVDYTLFTATDYDSIIYLLYFIEKYKINIIRKDTEFKLIKKYNKNDIGKIFNIYLNSYKNKKNYLKNLSIMWYDNYNYCYSEGIVDVLKHYKNGITFIYVTIIGTEVDHANGLIIDHDMKRIIHFEPYGIININTLNDFDIKFKEIFKKILPTFTYYAPIDYMNINSFQTLSDETNTNLTKIGDIGGFCLAWTLWFLELYIINKKSNLTTLVKNAIIKIIDTKYLFSEYIRSYTSKLTKFRSEILSKNKYSKTRIYNTHRNDIELEEIFKFLNDLMASS